MKYETDYCTWIDVPYPRRNQAKALGARWDGISKRWYVPKHVSLLPFKAQGLLGGSRRQSATQAE